jgi:hypothetical protein
MMAEATLPIRHPRRFGFAIFNVAVLVLMVAWVAMRSTDASAGLAGLPNFALTTAGIAVLAVIWLGSWIAWGTMVWRRRAHAVRMRGAPPPV